MLQRRPNTFAQTILSLSFFRLRQGGGPYIPVSPSSGRNRQGSDDFRLHHYGRFLAQCLTQQCSTGCRLRVS